MTTLSFCHSETLNCVGIRCRRQPPAVCSLNRDPCRLHYPYQSQLHRQCDLRRKCQRCPATSPSIPVNHVNDDQIALNLRSTIERPVGNHIGHKLETHLPPAGVVTSGVPSPSIPDGCNLLRADGPIPYPDIVDHAVTRSAPVASGFSPIIIGLSLL